MHIWRWLSRIPAIQKQRFIKKGEEKNINDQEVFFLIHYMDTEAYLSRLSDIENIAKKLLKAAERTKNHILKSLSHEALGRLFFEKGTFLAALAQFEEALDEYITHCGGCGYKDEVYAKLNVWIGLSAIRTNDYKKATKAFKEAIKILEEQNEQRHIIGELKALLGDALSHIAPEEAVQAFEEAHELMKGAPSPLFISNGIKLFASLVFRRYFNEAANVLSEVAENMLRALNGMNIIIYRSFIKIYRNVFLKALRVIELENLSSIKDMLFGVEAIKGTFYLFRALFKPVLRLKDIDNYNQAILLANRLKFTDYLEEMIEKKRKFLKMYDIGDLSPYKLRNLMGFSDKVIRFDTLIQRARLAYQRILVLSFTKLQQPNFYLLVGLEVPSGSVALIKRIIIDPDIIITAGNRDAESISKELKSILPSEIEEILAEFTENDLVVISPDGALHEIPWELYPIEDKETPYLGLKTNILRVPTIYQLIFWNVKNIYSPYKIAIVETSKSEKKIRQMISKALKHRGYKVYAEGRESLRLMMSNFIDLFHLSTKEYQTIIDEFFISIGGKLLSITDIEKLDLSGGIAVLDIPNSLSIVEDEDAYHSLSIAFQIAGFKSIVAIADPLDEKSKINLFSRFYNLKNTSRIGDIILKIRKMFYSANKSWWYKIVLLGDPMFEV